MTLSLHLKVERCNRSSWCERWASYSCQASSVAGVEKLMRGGLKPTVAIIDHKMPIAGDGEKAANIVRKMSPSTVIVSLSGTENVTWGDHNLLKDLSGPEFIDFLTNLQH